MNIPIWPGSSSFQPGETPFGFYDNDPQFQSQAQLDAEVAAEAKLSAKRDAFLASNRNVKPG